MPRAVIVDDEPPANALLAALVHLRGFEAVSAYDAAQAAPLVASVQPDVVLLDLMLPDRSGHELCREWALARETCASPVVIVSAGLVEQHRAAAYRAGACGYIAKPFTPDLLFEALERALRWRADLLELPSEITMDLCKGEMNVHHDRARLRCAILSGGTHLSPLAAAVDDIALGLFDSCVLKDVRATLRLEHNEVQLQITGAECEGVLALARSCRIQPRAITAVGSSDVTLAWNIGPGC
jgi:DNA-binding response OmpR family regulator